MSQSHELSNEVAAFYVVGSKVVGVGSGTQQRSR